MTHLSLSFLGGFEVGLDAEPVTAFGADKVRALLAYLSIESSRPHRRAELSAMFWPDLPESKAAHNLSQSLLRLRQALREKDRSANFPFLLVTTQDVQFNEASDWKLDVTRFRALLNMCRQHHHTDAARCEICSQWRCEAAELYRGDLLKGLFLPDSARFEEWQLINQEELRRLASETFQWLTNYYEQCADFEQMQGYAQRQIMLEPWSEDAQVQLMRALVCNGQRSAALKQYEQFARALDKELAIKPSAEASSFYKQIRSGEANPVLAKPTSVETAWLSEHGERRQVTALACGHIEPDDPDELQEGLVHCEQHCAAIFNRFGGKRLSRQGNTCLVYFGYPQAFEDAARRAVHSGLAITAALGKDYPLGIGIHMGPMMVGEKRGHRWQDRDLVGAIPEIARDCQRMAGPGEVLLSEHAKQLVQEYFECQKAISQTTTTKGQPLAIYQVSGERRVQNRLEWLAQTQRLTAFSGRAEELTQLKACFELSAQGQGQVVLLKGEPGIGKSRLVWEFEHTNPGTALWLSTRCMSHNQNTALHPLIELFERQLNFHPADSLELRHEKLAARLAAHGLMRPSAIWLLSILLGLPTDVPAPETITKAQRNQMRELFIALLKRISAEQPIVLVIEDLHWSDPSTVEWLGQSIESLGSIRCLTLLTARPGFKPAWLHNHKSSALQIISINPLTTEQVEKMIFDLADMNMLDEHSRRRIVDYTDGNPLYVEELTKTLLEQSVTKIGERNDTNIPGTLMDSLVARLDHLGLAKETAQWAAVLGRDFSYQLLKACTQYDDSYLQDRLAYLIEAELIAPLSSRTINKKESPYYTFKHALVKEAAYISLLKKTRELYHRRVANAIETSFPQIAETQPEVLAHHYSGADDRSRAVDYWMRAGERATAQGATLEARIFFDHVLEMVEATDYEQRWQALFKRDAVFDLREERDAQRQDIEALLVLAKTVNNDTWLAQAFLLQTVYALRLKNFPLMLSAAEAAGAAAARAGEETLEVQTLSRKILALTYMEKWEAAGKLIEELLRRLPGVANEVTQAYILGDMALYYYRVGDVCRALSAMQRSVDVARRVGDRRKVGRVDVNIGFTYTQLGCYTEARNAFEDGLANAESIGDQALQTTLTYNMSYVYWCSGDRELALETGEQALLKFRTASHNPFGQACCLAYLGIYLEEAQEYVAAATYLTEARTLYASIEVNSLRMEAQALEARVAMARGCREDAQALAAEVWTYICERGTDGMDFPSRAYNCIADIASAFEIPGMSAHEVIDAGYRDLMQRAENISNETWRRSFLENVIENRVIIERWNLMK